MNAVIACLISNLSMNSDSVSFSFVLASLICCIQLYMTLPFLFPFLCVFHSNSETLFFISPGALVSHTFPSFIHVLLSLSSSCSSSSLLLL